MILIKFILFPNLELSFAHSFLAGSWVILLKIFKYGRSLKCSHSISISLINFVKIGAKFYIGICGIIKRSAMTFILLIYIIIRCFL